jgi:Holliday junction resolvase RusA-like endonuclease
VNAPVYAFTIPGKPQAQARHRTRVVTTKGGKSFAMNYDPKESKDWKSKVAIFAQKAGVQPIQGPVCVTVFAVMPRPKRLCRRSDAEGFLPCESKPDWDNIGKGICDALIGVAFADDSQVISGRVIKMYHEKDGVPRTHVLIGIDTLAMILQGFMPSDFGKTQK